MGIGLSATGASAAEPVRIAVEGAFPPFNYLDSNQKLQGFDVEIADALCKAASIQCEFVVEEWDSMIPDLLADKYDVIVSSMSMSQERRQKVAFTARYYDSPSVLVRRKDDPVKGVAKGDWHGVKLGVTLSTAQAAYAQEKYEGAKITVFDKSPELYQGLEDGSVDIILEDKLAIYDWLANTKAGQCCDFDGGDIKDPVYFGEGAGIALRKEDTALLSQLNAALSQIQSDGTYDRINAKYFPFSIR
nr:transporter substrate-binding domain-containing protein [Rhizobium halophytocola]